MAQYVYGKNVIISLLKAGRKVEKLWMQKGHKDAELEELARSCHLAIDRADKRQLDRMVAGNHQGYVALVEEYQTCTLKELLEGISDDHQPLLVALDQLQDPHNLGAILRTAACAGADGLIIEKNRSVSLNATVAKVSTGAIDIIPVAEVTNLSQALIALKKEGYWVVGTSLKADRDYRSVDYDMPVVMVVGSEGEGMRRLVEENCDILVRMPMENGMESLNASVAAGIMMYQIYNSRFPVR
ncbi:MAG: 23S rRNA (guanosine(2251)-2'-O)-methyltransferase RlmB [Erysipelotrichaceae bacterium]|nr:23S rRNA (guanosine(2251)-2'-O)-methyltransferase RlmB [Erysipelotrichaceae bacterium]MBR5049205.1 23S rRNA (guanosine(2251)-2'-O)-methyltransferase RlmB [Erysipelotrichaceae bacterium]